MTILSSDGIETAMERGEILFLDGNNDSYPFAYHFDDGHLQGGSVELGGHENSRIWRTSYRIAHGDFKPDRSKATLIEPDSEGKITLHPNEVVYVEGPKLQTDYHTLSQGRSSLGRHFIEANVIGNGRKNVLPNREPRPTWIELQSHVHTIRLDPTDNLAHYIFEKDDMKIPENDVRSNYGKLGGFGLFEDIDLKRPIPLGSVRRGSKVGLTLSDEDVKIAVPSSSVVEFKGEPSLKELEEELYQIASFHDGELVIPPGTRMLAHTNEVVHLSDEYIGIMDDYSPEADLHPHVSAGIGDPGFHGQYTLEIVYNGQTPLCLKSGNEIARYGFHKLDQRTSKPYGSEKSKGGNNQYKGQEGTTLPRSRRGTPGTRRVIEELDKELED